MNAQKVIPVLRMFEYTKAKEFYIEWLGFKIDWEHTFHPGAPLYVQISLNEIVLHLSEHHGDGSPGVKVVVQCSGLEEFHSRLIEKNYSYNKPGLEEAPWNALTMEVIDPFQNRLLFNQAR